MKTRVWVIEDDDDLRMLAAEAIGKTLNDLGADAEVRVSRFFAYPPHFEDKTNEFALPHFVVLDLYDPDHNFCGAEFYDALRKHEGDSRRAFVLVWSHWAGEPEAERWLNAMEEEGHENDRFIKTRNKEIVRLTGVIRSCYERMRYE